MIKNDERRAAAARLRQFLSMPQSEHAWGYDWLQTVGSLVGASFAESIIMRLANLIDIPTCNNASGYQDVFECSECHCKVEITSECRNEYGGTFLVPFLPSYCPDCGAEVVE